MKLQYTFDNMHTKILATQGGQLLYKRKNTLGVPMMLLGAFRQRRNIAVRSDVPRCEHNKASVPSRSYAHTDIVGILPSEEMIRANSTASVIRRDNIPSGKHKSGRVCGFMRSTNKKGHSLGVPFSC